MTISKISTFVSAPWLKQQILPAAQKLSSSLRVLDSAWDRSPDFDSYMHYQQEHIPTSLHFNIKEISTSKQQSLHFFPIPETKVFKQYVEHLGISNDTHVVVYDGSYERKPAFRTWYLLRLFGHDKVSVLNGGLQQWKSHGYEVTTDEPKVEAGVFEPNFRQDLLRDFDAMKENLTSKREQVVDSRPMDFVDEFGYIPGSALLPFTEFLREDGTIKDEAEVKKAFEDVKIDLNKPLVVTCQIAMTACCLAAAAHYVGKEIPVYNGSFTEWSQKVGPDLIARTNKSQ